MNFNKQIVLEGFEQPNHGADKPITSFKRCGQLERRALWYKDFKFSPYCTKRHNLRRICYECLKKFYRRTHNATLRTNYKQNIEKSPEDKGNFALQQLKHWEFSILR